GEIRAVDEFRSLRLTGDAVPDRFDVLAELDVHALVEDIEGAVPVAGGAEGLAVADDAAVELIDLFETAVLHQHGQDLAADSARAVGDHRLVLEIVVFAGFDLGDEIAGGIRIGDDGVAELPDLRFHRVAAIEEDDVIAAFVEELVQRSRLEVLPSALDAVVGHRDLIGGAEGDELVTDLHAQAREVVALPVGPLDIGLLERGVGLRGPHVLLDVEDVSAHRRVDAVLRHDDAAFEPEALGQGVLPQSDGLGVGQWSEDVEQDDLGSCHDSHSKRAVMGPRSPAPPARCRSSWAPHRPRRGGHRIIVAEADGPGSQGGPSWTHFAGRVWTRLRLAPSAVSYERAPKRTCRQTSTLRIPRRSIPRRTLRRRSRRPSSSLLRTPMSNSPSPIWVSRPTNTSRSSRSSDAGPPRRSWRCIRSCGPNTPPTSRRRSISLSSLPWSPTI